MNPPVLIKKLVSDNVEVFFNLRLESLQISPESFLSSYEDEKKKGSEFYINILKSDDSAIFGAFTEDRLIGIVGLYREPYRRLQHKSILWGTYVTPEFLGHGIAKQLINAAIVHARKSMRSVLICLTVGTNNIPARKLYESLGFKTWGIEKKAILIDGKLLDENHMSLLL